MRVLYDDRLHVSHWQLHVLPEHLAWDAEYGDRASACGGQQNGLCGAATPGTLYLEIGVHSGAVPFRVVLHDGRPEVEDVWEDVVEVSFRASDEPLVLLPLMDGGVSLDLPSGDYRVRYSTRGLDAAREKDTLLDGEEPIDHYELVFWPAPPAPDEVVRRTSSVVASWQAAASALTETAPGVWSAGDEDLQGSPVQEWEDHEDDELEPWDPRDHELHIGADGVHRNWREADAHYAEAVLRDWGGRPVDDETRLRFHGRAPRLAGFDRDLVDGLLAMSSEEQQEVAFWVLQHLWHANGFDRWPGARDALSAVRRGDPPPRPYDDASWLVERLAPRPSDASGPTIALVSQGWDEGPSPFPASPIDPLITAACLIVGFAEPHQDRIHLVIPTLEAAMEVVGVDGAPALRAAIIEAFPELA